jgi:hypothetical protein
METERPVMTPKEAAEKMHELAKLPDAERIRQMRALSLDDLSDIQAVAMVANLNHNVVNGIDPETVKL